MKQYIILFLCLLATITYSQDKKVHLAHGLGGGEDSWAKFDNFLQDECSEIETSRFEMVSVDGIEVYSAELEENLAGIEANENDIAIGHSFGGINLRYMDVIGTSGFGGYITVGSAHHGALLADNSLNGTLEAYFHSGCREVVTEPAVAIGDLATYPAFITKFIASLIEEHEETICQAGYDALLDSASDFIGDGTTIQQLQIEGGIVSELPAGTLPSIGVVCSVEGHPLWSLLSDYKNGSIDLSNIENTMNLVEGAYVAGSNILRVLANFSFSKNYGRKLRKASRELSEGAQWIDGTEVAWSNLIGAGGDISWTQQAQQNWVCHCFDVQQGIPVPCDFDSGSIQIIELLEIGQVCDNDFPSCWETTLIEVPVFGPITQSDGLVPIENQELPGANHEEFINDVSHFAQPSDSGVHAVLLEQLNPGSSPNFFFKVNNCL